MRIKWTSIVLFVLVGIGCASGSGTAPDNTAGHDVRTGDTHTQDIVPDKKTADAPSSPDVAVDATNDTAVDTVKDTIADNSPRDATGDSGDVVVQPCSMISQGHLHPPAPKPKKFAVGIFHFNIQYVAGGLKGFKDNPMFDMNAEQVEDAIITQSLDPLLDILLDHPHFAADVEMQGYMLDVIRQRHPATLKKLWKLVRDGQIEVMSFHYSDQLFVAHNKWSMQRSIELNREAFDAACLPVAPAVFCQEGQFSEGMQVMMGQAGQSVGVLKGMYGYSVKDRVNALLYRLRGRDVVTTDSMTDADSGIEVKWYAVDDGEVLVTNGLNPYLGKGFKFTDTAKKKLVGMFQDLLDKGYFMTTVGDYVHYLHDYDVKAVKLPFILDGTWHPSRSDNLFAWMGRRGMFGDGENDNGVMTGLEESALDIKALEALIAFAKTKGVDVKKFAGIAHALARTQVLAEVSDATGWNPWKGEVEYALTRIASVKKDSYNAIKALAGKVFQGKQILVNLATGAVTDKIPETPVQEDKPVDPQWDVSVEADGFNVKQSWFEVPSKGQGVYRLDVSLTKTDQSKNTMQITFALNSDKLMYTPAMLDDTLETIPFDQIATDPFTVGLANGLIALDKDTFLVEDTRSIHLAVHVDSAQHKLWFRDETINGSQPVTYHIYILKSFTGPDAVEFAKTLNITPTMTFNLND